MEDTSTRYKLSPAGAALGLRKQPLTHCLCCSVKVGSLILGWFHVIICSLAIPVFVTMLVILTNNPSAFKELHADDKELVDKIKKIDPRILQLAFVPIIFALAIILLLHVMLLVGIYKKKTSVLSAYVICIGCIVCLRMIGVCRSFSHRDPVPIILGEMTMFGLSILGLITVYSYKIQLMNERATREYRAIQENCNQGMSSGDAPPPYDCTYYKEINIGAPPPAPALGPAPPLGLAPALGPAPAVGPAPSLYPNH